MAFAEEADVVGTI
ncbi:28dd4cc3-4a2a-4c0b-bfd4-1e87fb9e0664 [Thermothielavioides terrestris]|uniref:28dd4cc3-4a2a-4c0b-bfd4-1e87fb9e0664 n=1 Tax=Thermothielavioides terrestris TaxID=2587410 RepID=A0A446BCZ9_9PEZI|nr:28dd4cc3-4a2a-4c0b-bfd4-1e87fb9e0664 [Thermothielavioides terrestris]